MISPADLLSVLKLELLYDQETGLFAHATDKRSGRKGGRVIAKAGDVAGWKDQQGYIHIRVAGRGYRAHRIAWLLMTGTMPRGEIDHINGVRHDNRWVNLRDVTKVINQQNRLSARSDNSVGLLGVTKRENGTYRATIQAGGRWFSVGHFATKEEASAAYLAAKHNYHAEAMAR